MASEAAGLDQNRQRFRRERHFGDRQVEDALRHRGLGDEGDELEPGAAGAGEDVPVGDPNTIDRDVPLQPVRRSDAGYDVSQRSDSPPHFRAALRISLTGPAL